MKKTSKQKIMPVLKMWLIYYMRRKKEAGIDYVIFPSNHQHKAFKSEFEQIIKPEINFLLKELFPGKNYQLKYNYHFSTLLYQMVEEKKIYKNNNGEVAKNNSFHGNTYYCSLDDNTEVDDLYWIVKDALKNFGRINSDSPAEDNVSLEIKNGCKGEFFESRVEINNLIRTKEEVDIKLIKIIKYLYRENEHQEVVINRLSKIINDLSQENTYLKEKLKNN